MSAKNRIVNEIKYRLVNMEPLYLVVCGYLLCVVTLLANFKLAEMSLAEQALLVVLCAVYPLIVVPGTAAALIPIVCIGETLAEREGNQTLDVLDRQIKGGFDRITGDQIAGLVVAYEPVWAIGTGRTATAAQAQEAHAHIRQRLRQWFGGPAADQCHVIYGGSVKPENTAELVGQPDVDGALVGGASLDVKGFYEIVSRARTRNS